MIGGPHGQQPQPQGGNVMGVPTAHPVPPDAPSQQASDANMALARQALQAVAEQDAIIGGQRLPASVHEADDMLQQAHAAHADLQARYQTLQQEHSALKMLNAQNETIAKRLLRKGLAIEDERGEVRGLSLNGETGEVEGTGEYTPARLIRDLAPSARPDLPATAQNTAPQQQQPSSRPAPWVGRFVPKDGHATPSGQVPPWAV